MVRWAPWVCVGPFKQGQPCLPAGAGWDVGPAVASQPLRGHTGPIWLDRSVGPLLLATGPLGVGGLVYPMPQLLQVLPEGHWARLLRPSALRTWPRLQAGQTPSFQEICPTPFLPLHICSLH